MANYATWLTTAWEQYQQMTAYMVEHYSIETAERFTDKLLYKIERAMKYPDTGTPSRVPEVRYMKVTKYRAFFYRFQGQTLYIVFMWDARQNPRKNPYL